MMRIIRWITSVLILFAVSTSCDGFLEIDPPNSMMNKQTVFLNEGTAKGALTGLYAKIHEYGSGYRNTVGVYAALSADELTYLMIDNLALSYANEEINQNAILPNNVNIQGLWAALYNTVYSANSFLEGIQDHGGHLPDQVRTSLTGQALFLRAFSYFYLVNLFGEVPLATGTDYRINALLPRGQVLDIYALIKEDLTRAEVLLEEAYTGKDRTRVNKAAVRALLGRVCLYLGQWEQAESWSSKVINQTGIYRLEDSLNRVFLKDSKEAIWQVSRTGNTQNAYDAALYLQNSWHVLSSEFVEGLYTPSDLRSAAWLLHKDPGRNLYVPYKYRSVAVTATTEHSVIMRLAEQYFIRAEARMKQGDIQGAASDLDMIRLRAGLPNIASVLPVLDGPSLMDMILDERKRELFAEWGHRWLDLKRTGRAVEVLSKVKPGFSAADEWYPIPESEQLKNPNLK